MHINANNRVGCLFFNPDPTNLKHSGSGAFIYHFSPVVGNETDNPKLPRRLCSKPTSVSQRNPLLVAKELLRYFMHRACYVVTPRSAEEISGVTSVRPSHRGSTGASADNPQRSLLRPLKGRKGPVRPHGSACAELMHVRDARYSAHRAFIGSSEHLHNQCQNW